MEVLQRRLQHQRQHQLQRLRLRSRCHRPIDFGYHEPRDGMEKLQVTDGYRITLARDEQDAMESAQRVRPDLILVSLAGLPREVILSVRNIRQRARIGELVPVVVF